MTQISPKFARFAIVNNSTGEILDVGLRGNEAHTYATTYNRIMDGTGNSVSAVPVTMHIGDFEIPNDRPAFLPANSESPLTSDGR